MQNDVTCSGSEFTLLAFSCTCMRFCSVWSHSLKNKSDCWPLAWEVICQVWDFIGVHRTVCQHMMALSPSYIGTLSEKPPISLACRWERCQGGGVHQGTQCRACLQRLLSAPSCCVGHVWLVAALTLPFCRQLQPWLSSFSLFLVVALMPMAVTSPRTDSSKRSISSYHQIVTFLLRCDFPSCMD